MATSGYIPPTAPAKTVSVAPSGLPEGGVPNPLIQRTEGFNDLTNENVDRLVQMLDRYCTYTEPKDGEANGFAVKPQYKALLTPVQRRAISIINKLAAKEIIADKPVDPKTKDMDKINARNYLTMLHLNYGTKNIVELALKIAITVEAVRAQTEGLRIINSVDPELTQASGLTL